MKKIILCIIGICGVLCIQIEVEKKHRSLQEREYCQLGKEINKNLVQVDLNEVEDVGQIQKLKHLQNLIDPIILPLNSFYGIAYLAPLYFGSNSIFENQIFDTGSGWITVPLSNCSDCQNTNYDYSASSTAQVDTQRNDSQLIYGSAILDGFAIQDTVCLDNKTINCVSDFEFFGFYKQIGLDGEIGDGILGLAPIDEDNGPSYIEGLYNDEQIPSLLMGIYISPTGDNSTIEFGGYNKEYLKEDLNSEYNYTGLHYYTLAGTTWWELQLTASNYGSQSMSQKNGATAIIDSGTTLITLPLRDYNFFLDELIKDIGGDNYIYCEQGICFLLDYCQQFYDKVQSLYFGFGDDWYWPLPPNQFLLDSEPWIGTEGYCILGIQAMEFDNKYILGDVFLKNFYQVYNLQSNTIGLGVAVSSNIQLVDSLPNGNNTGMSGFIIFCIVLILLVGVLFIAWFVYRRYKKKNQQNEVNNALYANPNQNRTSQSHQQKSKIIDKKVSINADNEQVTSLMSKE